MIGGDVGKALLQLDGNPDYRVLRRFRPRHAYGIVDEPKVGLFVDVETTGLNTELDKVIQFAAVQFEFDKAGNIGHVGPTYNGLEDPMIPLPEDIVRITGITDERLKGQKIDDEKVALIRDGVQLVIAHNADFDRKMVEARFPGFDKLAWACSQRDVPWETAFGSTGLKLDYLMVMLCGEFYDAHDALADCLAGVHLLATPRAGGKSAAQLLLDSVRQPTLRVYARAAAFGVKDKLRSRRYRWYPEPTRCWAKDVKADEVQAERDWLRKEIYGGEDLSSVSKISAFDRYSVRAA